MIGRRLLEETFACLRDTGQWPLVRTLQVKFGPTISVRAVAAELGPDRIVCQDGLEGVCFLTLASLSQIPGAADDLETLARALRFIAETYAAAGSKPITHTQLQTALGLQPIPLKRLGLLLRLVSGPWTGGSWSNDGTTFSVNPGEDAFFYIDVHSYHDVVGVQERLLEQQQSIARALSYGWERQRPGSSRTAPEPTGWPKVDRQTEDMRSRLATAKTEEQHQAVGLLCREVLISIAEAAHDPAKHPFRGELPVSPTDAKRRLEALFDAELPGEANEEARAHAKAAVRLADALQHKRTADFRTAALCAEATTSVVNLAAIAVRKWT